MNNSKEGVVFNLAGVNRPENPEDFTKGSFGNSEYGKSKKAGFSPMKKKQVHLCMFIVLCT